MIVVSEIGEQWSPHTEPARQADMPMICITSPEGKIVTTIGIRMPNVPHDVPVAKEIPQATRKIIAGRKDCRLPAALPITSEIKGFAPRTAVMFLRDVANVRIRIAGTIAINPLGMHSIASLIVITLRRQRKMIVKTSAIILPHGRPTVASVSEKAEMKKQFSQMCRR